MTQEAYFSSKYKKSQEWYERAREIIPSATQTFSKGPSQYPFGASPIYLERGSGSHVWDVDGNEFIDYPLALGSIILGHAYPTVTLAITEQAKKGINFSLNATSEVEIAEELVELIPCAEMVRFGKNGSDVTAGAIRAARAFTKREKILSCGYHGWQDWYIASTTRDKGVPGFAKNLIQAFPYNDIEALKKIFAEQSGQIAAVIMEPVSLDEPLPGYLAKVKEVANENGALLIFDEIVTGFRFHVGGAQAHFGVTPDLACFGKALGNGMPISAVVGRKDVMAIFDEVFFSFTFGGEALSLAAAGVVLSEMVEHKIQERFWRQGAVLRDGYNALVQKLDLQKATKCSGMAPRTAIMFDPVAEADALTLRTLFQQECIERGVLALGIQNLSFSHSDKDIEQTLAVYEETLTIMKKAIEANDVRSRIRGRLVEAVFRPLKFTAPKNENGRRTL